MGSLLEVVLSVSVGLGLSAACGFKVFVPMLFMSIAAHTGHLTLAPGWEWLGSTPALILLGTATAAEICAYYVPVVDHFLDMVAAPAAVVAGSVVAAAVFVDMSPMLKWSLAIVAGGGAATVTHVGKSVARAAISIPTMGLGNWMVTTGEVAASAGASFLTLLLPIVGLLVVGCVFVLFFGVVRRCFRRRSADVGCECRA